MTTRTMTITGVGGFIGDALARRALREGWRVRGVDINTRGARRVSQLGVEVFAGDLTDAPAQRWCTREPGVLVHAAAIVREGGDRAAFERLNVRATAQLANAAAEGATERMIHLSTTSVYGFDFPEFVSEDGALYRGPNPYCASKAAGDREALRRHDPARLDVVVLRPGDVWGPHSKPWTVRPIMLMRRRLFVLPDGARGVLSPVYIENLLDAIMLAAETPHTGAAYNITDGTPMTTGDLFGRYHELLGRRRPIPTLPAETLRLSFAVAAAAAERAGFPPPVHPDVVDFLTRRNTCSIARAQEQLGYTPRVSFDEGMRRVRGWGYEMGWWGR